MRTHLLDDYIMSCLRSKDTLMMSGAMETALEQTRPIAHLWKTTDPLVTGLKNMAIKWPDSAMCLCIEPSITKGYHVFCVDQGYPGPIFERWIEQQPWSLEGLLVFQPDENEFDVVPLARSILHGTIMPELQLHFELTAEGWSWRKANTGPVNAFFHDVLIRAIGKEPNDIDERIDHLGNVINLVLGTYYSHIGQPGTFEVHAPKPPKVKEKNGKVVKVYRAGTVGYKRFIPCA